MRAGTGITHSEYNDSKAEPVHFLQIWIAPDTRGLAPTYGEQRFDTDAASHGFVLLASRDGREGSLTVHQNVDLWMARLGAGETRDLARGRERHAWIHVARGVLSGNGQALGEGDGASIEGETSLSFRGVTDAEVLVFDLA
jgi:quercetin 2,3-dioxygenase